MPELQERSGCPCTRLQFRRWLWTDYECFGRSRERVTSSERRDAADPRGQPPPQTHDFVCGAARLLSLPGASAHDQIEKMALLSPRVPRLPPSAFTAGGIRCCGRGARCQATAAGGVAAAGPPSSELEAIRWGSAKLQGARDEMEDEVVLRTGSLLDGFSFAAVLDGHAGFSAVQFLRHAPNPLRY